MIIGKVPENILKRSVLNRIRTKRSEVLVGADVGTDCAVLNFADNELMVVTEDPVTMTAKDQAMLSVYAVLNDLSAMGAECVAIMVTCILPPDSSEEDLKRLMDEIEKYAHQENVQIIGGHTEVSDIVTRPLLSLAGVGKVDSDKLVTQSGAKAGDDVVVTKWIGLEGTTIIAKEKETELLSKFPQKLIYDARNFDKYLSVIPEAATAVKSGVSAMHDASQGGIFAALWQIAASSGVGLEIDLKKIPVKQETIEICNFFDLNPYELTAAGSMVITTADGNDLVSQLKKEGINAVVVGKVTDSNDRVVYTEDTRRFLEPVRNEEIYKLFNK